MLIRLIGRGDRVAGPTSLDYGPCTEHNSDASTRLLSLKKANIDGVDSVTVGRMSLACDARHRPEYGLQAPAN